MRTIGEKGRQITLGIIGLGCRGQSQLKTLLQMEDVTVAAVCDKYEDRTLAAADTVEKMRGTRPAETLSYQSLLQMGNVEAVIIMTNWENHLLIAMDALKAGKRVAMEVGGAASVEECWQLIKLSEDTGLPVMLLENCCYGQTEMTILSMLRKGVFGELVHCQGGYQHDLRDEIGLGDVNRHYRQQHFLHRNAELYPTHELGPIAKYLRIGRGNRMVSLVSMASKAVGLHDWLAENRADTPLASAQVNEGDIVTTLIKCANGETIVLTHDCTLPRYYSRGGRVQGTKGLWMEDGNLIFLEGRTPNPDKRWDHPCESAAPYLAEYCHPLWQQYQEFGLRGGHGGMDYLCLRAFVESVQDHTRPPIDVYDAAAWLAITPLSEMSIAAGSAPVAIPDFTNGRWMQDKGVTDGLYALDDER